MKSRTPSFVIELGLKTGEDQESALETYFSDARQLFNAVLGTANIVEKNSYKAFQRAGYGKSLGKSGIAGLITRMTSKAESAGCCVVKVSPRKLRPSQHDPETGTYRKKALWERSHQLGDTGWYMDRDVFRGSRH